MPGVKLKLDIKEAERASALLRKELSTLGSAAVKNEKDFHKLEDRLHKGMKADRAKRNIDSLKRSINLTRLETAKLKVGIGDYSGAVKTMVSGNKDAITSFTKFGAVASGALAALGIGFGAQHTLSKFADFDKGLISVQKTTNLTDIELNQLADTVRDLSRHLPVGATRLLEIAEAAGQLGVNGRENIEIFTETMARLETASDVVGEEGAKKIARLLNVTGEAVSEVETFASVLVALGNNSAATESEILSLATEIGQATSTFEISSAEVAALSAAMKSMGVRAELGGSVVGRSMRAIQDAINEGGETFEYLQKLTKMTEDQLRRTFQTNSAVVFQAWIEGVGRMVESGDSASSVLENFGLKGEEVLKVLPTMATKSHLLADALRIANEETQDSTALLDESIRASESFSAQMSMTMSAVDEIAASIGKGLAPSVLDVTKKFRDWVDVNQDFINQDLPSHMNEVGQSLKFAGEASIGFVKRISNSARGAGMVAGGQLSFWDYLTANPEELARHIDEFERRYEAMLSGDEGLLSGDVVRGKIDSKTPGYEMYRKSHAKKQSTAWKDLKAIGDEDGYRDETVYKATQETSKKELRLIQDTNQRKYALYVAYGRKVERTTKDFWRLREEGYERAADSFQKYIEPQTKSLEEWNEEMARTMAIFRGNEAGDDTWLKMEKSRERANSAIVFSNEEMADSFDIARESGEATFSGLQSLADDFVDEQEITFKRFAAAVIKDLSQIFVKMIEIETKAGSMSGSSGFGGILSSIFGLFSGGGTDDTGNASGSVAVVNRAQGGWINEHIIGRGQSTGRVYELGEGGIPEMVTPKNKLVSGGGGGVNNYFYINAIDSKSFFEIVENNPDAIVKVSIDALNDNTEYRNAVLGMQ